jgi:hypothetical protein
VCTRTATIRRPYDELNPTADNGSDVTLVHGDWRRLLVRKS